MTDRTPERPLYDMFSMRAQKEPEDLGKRGDGSGFWKYHECKNNESKRRTQKELEDLRVQMELKQRRLDR